MPRTGGVYSPPAGTKGVPNTTIQSVPYNTLIDDLAADANAARPVTAGGTGATSAGGARTALGVEIGTNVQAYDAGLQSIAGLVTVADQMIYTTALDVYATTALTPFARTLLDDADAATARATLGANNASNLTAGTVSDARLPTTMGGKTFSAPITAKDTAAIDSDGNRSIVLRSAAGVTRGMVRHDQGANAIIVSLFDPAGTWYRDLVLNHDGGISWGNNKVWHAGNDGSGSGLDADMVRGLYPDVNATAASLVQRGVGGAVNVQDITATRGNGTGVIFLGGGSRYLHYDGAKYVMPSAGLTIGSELNIAGGAIYQGDGNVYMPWAGNYLSNVLNSKITTDGRAYPRRIGGGDLNFNWSGQGGQPSWLWGGNDGINMYVYNPSNFSVNYANSAGYAAGAGNADTVDGYHATDFSQIYKGTNRDETNLPIGTYLLVYYGAAVDRHLGVAVYFSGTTGFNISASGAQLSGTWRTRGCLTYSGSNNIVLVQRVA